MKKILVFIQRKPTFTGNSIAGHRGFLQTLREGGILFLAGGFADQSGGAYVIQAETIKEANEIVHKDPMFQENECVYQLKEWNVQ